MRMRKRYASMVRIRIVPCLKDNYAYVVTDDDRRAIVIDASEGPPVVAALEEEQLELVAVLATHHHWDHVGGHEMLARAKPGLSIFGSEIDRERIPKLTHTLADGAQRSLAGIEIRALHVPGHTRGALAYQVGDAVFTGDTLFMGGCGRLFEGDPPMMLASLEKLAALPSDTRVYCGHEYAEQNLRFATEIEPDNEAAKERLLYVQAQRQRGEPSVGSALQMERATNPFLRCGQVTLQSRFSCDSVVETFAAVRRAKDNF